MINRRLLHQARSERAAFSATVALSLFGGLLTVGQAWFLSRVLDRAFLQHASLAGIAPEMASLLGLSLLRAGAGFGAEMAAGGLAIRIKTDLRLALMEHLLALGPAFTQGERTGELSTAAMEGIEALDAYFRQYLPQVAVSALVPLSLLVVILPVDPLSALVLGLTAPLLPLFMILIGQTTEALTKRQYGLLSLLSAHLLDALQGLTTLKMLGQSRAEADTIGRVSQRYRRVTLEVLRVAFLSALALEMVATVSTAIVAVEVGLRLLYARIAFQEAMFILFLAPEFYLPLRALGARFHAGASGSAAAQRIFEVLDTPLPGPAPRLAEEAKAPNRVPSRFAIAFRDVSYEYRGARHALRGASFEIQHGTKVALVGPTGAGKSTLAYLLLRFLQPTSGDILINGISLAEFAPDIWRHQIAWVPQTPHLFHDTMAGNLRLARPEASEDDLLRAIERAQLEDVVAGLPLGLDTLVGEGGARLSGGQIQRLALARAFLKDSPFLLLDEPSSNVDPELEARLQESTDRLMAGRTVLVIAHRMSTVYEADEIVVLSEGRVVERGVHADLWEAGGLYHQLLAAYREDA